MRYLYCIAFVVLCSCAKHSDSDAPNQSGNIQGSITAYDRSGNENLQFDNISIKLIDAQKQVSVGRVDAGGKFQFEKILKGDVLLVFNKPGYGYIDSIRFSHNNPKDTLSNVTLIEDLPFTVKNIGLSYGAGWLNYPLTCDYHTTDQYMVTFLFCFSKTPDVNMTNAALILPYGGFWNVSYVNGYLGGKGTVSIDRFTEAGFKIGDKIYAALVPVSKKYGELYTEILNKRSPKVNYQIISVKAATTSNVMYFILNQ